MNEIACRLMLMLAGPLVLAVIPSHALADTLIGPNGERLPGHLIEEKNGVLVFQSDFLGRVEVRADLAHIEPDPAQTAIAPAPSTPAALPKAWSFDVGVRLDVDRGSLKTPEEDLGVDFKFEHKRPDGEFVGTVSYDYDRSDGVLKDDDWLLSLSYDRFISEDRFVAGRQLSTRELNSEGYDNTGTISVAYGWRLWEAPKQFIRIGPSLGYISIERAGIKSTGPAFGLYVHSKGPLWRKINFNSEVQVLQSPGKGRYVNVDVSVRQPLSDRLYLAFVWDYVWSNFEVESGIKSVWRWEMGWQFGADK
jgi:hypothetical protein